MKTLHWSITLMRCWIFNVYQPCINTLRPRQNGCHFPDDIFKWIFLNENVWISINIPLKFVLRGPINNIPTLVQVMAWHPPGDKPLSEPMMVRLPMHICVIRSRWVKTDSTRVNGCEYTIVTAVYTNAFYVKNHNSIQNSVTCLGIMTMPWHRDLWQINSLLCLEITGWFPSKDQW